jgi:5-methyltetrahydropteroyltriglutamate--homocysteine methyltransferase
MMKPLAGIRTDVVGSLLRPAYLKESRLRCDQGEIESHELRAVEDRAIRAAVLLQEEAGLDVVTDGEFRRLNFQDSFGACVAGFDAGRSDLKFYEARVEGSRPLQRWEIPDREAKGTAVAQRRPVVERLRLLRNGPLEEYLFASRVARRPAKVTLIGPDRISQRFDQKGSKAVYPTVDDFMADVVRIERDDPRTDRGRLPLHPDRRPGLHRLRGSSIPSSDAPTRRGSHGKFRALSPRG